jgi:hypothetical protein
LLVGLHAIVSHVVFASHWKPLLGLSVPAAQLNDATFGTYSEVHRAVHEDPEAISDPSLQVLSPLLSWFITVVGPVHGFAWQVNVVGVSCPSSQLNDASFAVYPDAHFAAQLDPEVIKDIEAPVTGSSQGPLRFWLITYGASHGKA